MSTANRTVLPFRRSSEVFEHKTGQGILYTVTVGFYEDGNPAEVFIDAGKAGSDAQVIARDAAVLLSLLLQYGCGLRHIRHAISRNNDGTAQGPIGAILDMMEAGAC